MYRWIFMAALSALFAVSAVADSMCGFSRGMIGTKAVGYVWPFSLLNRELNPHSSDCALSAFAEPGMDEPEGDKIPCYKFRHVRTPYIDGGPGWRPMEGPTKWAESEYFALLVFDVEAGFFEVERMSGERVWVNARTPSRVASLETQFRDDVVPTETGIYRGPSFDQPIGQAGRDGLLMEQQGINREAWDEFFRHDVFDLYKELGTFKSGDLWSFLARSVWENGLEMQYRNLHIVIDDDGREWLKADQYVLQHPSAVVFEEDLVGNFDVSVEEKDRLRRLTDNRVESEILRTVYFPHREPNGTIIMVMTDGLGCD